MAEPIIGVFRKNYPQAQIAVVMREYSVKVLAGHPEVDRLIPCQDKSLEGFGKLVSEIKSYAPDLVVILPNSLRTYASVRLAFIRNIVGYRRGIRKYLLKGPIAAKENGKYLPVPMTDYFLEICRWMGLSYDPKVIPQLYLTEAEVLKGDALLQKYEIDPDDRVVALNPGAQFGSSKCWPPEYFARLGEMLHEQYQCKILILVGPGEDNIAAKIVAASNVEMINTGPDKVDLGILKTLIKRCDLLITNDTGPRHYAVAFDKPVVVLMGATDPRHTNCHLQKTVILREDIPCSPCHKKICPIDHPCMVNLIPEKVFSAVQKINWQRGINESAPGSDYRRQAK